MAHDSTPSPAAVVSTDEDAAGPLIRRRNHPQRDDPWFLADDDHNMPVKKEHVDNAIALLHSIERRVHTRRLDGAVYMDLAWRFDAARPYRGIDPDVMLVAPAPPRADKLKSLRAWAPGHVPPKLGIEIVSDKTARKDYTVAPGRYAAGKVSELVIFDPDRHRLRDVDGPYVLQVWRRTAKGRMVRRYAGDGPFESVALGAWLVVVGGALRVADDREGQRVWPTHEEAERTRAESEHERAENARRSAARMLARRVERRLGRELSADERRSLDARMQTAAAEVLDEEVEGLPDADLAAWLARG